MKHNIPLLILPLLAAADIEAHRMLTIGKQGVTQASVGSAVIGVSGRLAVKDGTPVDVVTAGLIPVEYGDAIAIGTRVGTDNEGRAFPSDMGGFIALESGETGFIGSVMPILSGLSG